MSSKLDFHDYSSTTSRKFECCVGSINPTSFFLTLLHLLVNKFEALESNRNLLFFIFYKHCVDATFRVCLFCVKCLCFCKILSPLSSMARWKSWSMKPFIAQWKIGWGEWVQLETSGSHSPCFPLERNKSFSPCFPLECDSFSSFSRHSYVNPCGLLCLVRCSSNPFVLLSAHLQVAYPFGIPNKPFQVTFSNSVSKLFYPPCTKQT